MSDTFIYCIQSENGLIKIGITRHPDRRLDQIQRQSPHHRLRFAWIGAPEGDAYGIEQETHAALDQYRHSGEWYRITDDAAVGMVCATAQRRGQHIVGCDLDMARQILQAGQRPYAKPRPTVGALIMKVFFAMGITIIIFSFVMRRIILP